MEYLFFAVHGEFEYFHSTLSHHIESRGPLAFVALAVLAIAGVAALLLMDDGAAAGDGTAAPITVTDDRGRRPGTNVPAPVATNGAEGRPLDFDLDDVTGSLALELDLPIDRLAERNAYRAALISLQATERDALDLADDIRGQLRAALREALATVETNAIQRGAVVLAERRVESTALRMAAGRADTRDILEAQEDLLAAQNAATSTLINFWMARYDLYLDMESLRVEETGIRIEGLEPGALRGTEQ